MRDRGTRPRRAVEASIGVAQWGEPLTADELLDRADRALLLAKRTRQGARGGGRRRDSSRSSRWWTPAPARPQAIMREFWEMVAASESSRDTLLNLPAFVRRALAAEEVAVYDYDGAAGLTRRAVALPPDDQESSFAVARVQATGAMRERLALGAISRPHAGGPPDRHRRSRTCPKRATRRAGAYAVVPLLWRRAPARPDRGADPAPSFPTERLRQARAARSPDDGRVHRPARGRLARRRPGARGGHRRARQLHPRALRAGRRRSPPTWRSCSASRRPSSSGAPRRAAARRRQARDPQRDPAQARPADRRRVAGDAPSTR